MYLKGSPTLLFRHSWSWGKVAQGLEHLCTMSMALGSISNPKPTPQTEFNPKFRNAFWECQLIACGFFQHPLPFGRQSLRSAQYTLWWQRTGPCSSSHSEALHGAPASQNRLKPPGNIILCSRKQKWLEKQGLGLRMRLSWQSASACLDCRRPCVPSPALHTLVHSGRWRQEHSGIKTRKGKD